MTKGSTFFGPRSARYGLSRDLGVASATKTPDGRSPGPRDISENYIQAARTTASAERKELSPRILMIRQGRTPSAALLQVSV